MFYIPYKLCKHILINIDLIGSLYERFDKLSYLTGVEDFELVFTTQKSNEQVKTIILTIFTNCKD